jgi:hypothetical protein
MISLLLHVRSLVLPLNPDFLKCTNVPMYHRSLNHIQGLRCFISVGAGLFFCIPFQLRGKSVCCLDL